MTKSAIHIARIIIFLMFAPVSVHAYTDTAILLLTGQGDYQLSVQLAKTDTDRMNGLMHRKTLEPYHGMLFDFDREIIVRMWMKNTPLPLDMVFFDRFRKVNHVHAGAVPFSEAIIEAPYSAQYVLELPAGSAKNYGIDLNSHFEWATP